MRGVRTVVAAAALAVCLLAPGVARAQTSSEPSEVVSLLRDLVRLNTSNPPGNEGQVAEYLAAKLRPLGFEVDVIQTPQAGKAHLVARLRSANPTEKPLLLAGHADTVGVEAPLWTTDPFGGDVIGRFIYGRGTLDVKGGLAAFTVAAMRLARSGVALKRDVILLSQADEEGGAGYDTDWLWENYPSKVDAGVSLNEGGWTWNGGGSDGTAASLMALSVLDKQSLSVKVTARGRSTHSSHPIPDSAIVHLSRALDKLAAYQGPPRITPAARDYLTAWARSEGRSRLGNRLRLLLSTKSAAERREVAERIRGSKWGFVINGLVRNIFIPTIVDAGFRANVLPGTATATVNIRMLPGQKTGPMLRIFNGVVDDPRITVAPVLTGTATAEEVLAGYDKRADNTPSSTDTDLFRSMVSQAKREWPGVEVSRSLFEAGTDAAPWRERGIPVYGIYPYPISREDLTRMHGNDERIPTKGLEEGTDMLTRVLTEVAGA